METLPEDVILNILSRLPAKCVTRLKIVCKLGYHLISDPNFMKLHLERSLATQSNLHFVIQTPIFHLVDFDTFDNPTKLDYPFRHPHDGGVIIIGSCHGLLCVGNYDRDLPIFFYNPTTQTHKLLPHVPSALPIIVFKMSFNFGFGYDNFTGDYKCVRILQLLDKDASSFVNEVMVYSMKADSWRRVQDLPHYFYYRNVPSAFVGGAIHWIGHDGNGVYFPILRFDLNDETFGSIPLPYRDDEHIHSPMSVGVLDSCLCLMDNEIEFSHVWMMKEYGSHESWMKLFSIKQQRGIENLERTVSYSITKKELFLRLWCCDCVKIDLETMEVTDVKVAGFRRLLDMWVCAENFVMLNDECDDPVSEQEEGTKKTKKKRKNKLKKQKKWRRTVRLVRMTTARKLTK